MTSDPNSPNRQPGPGAAGNCVGCGRTLAELATDPICPRCLLESALAFVGKDSSPFSAGESVPGTPRTLGDYELLERIASGGMGVVFKARQKRLDRIVAVKILPFGSYSRESFLKRFRREAVIAARLQHPNIVAVHEVGEEFGQPYYSMDFVEGPSLLQLLRSEPIAVARAARFVETIARAVHYAHGMGVLHRDLKPANVLVDALDQPRVTDFGLAKDLATDLSATQSSLQFGSPSYMPPELARGFGASLPNGDPIEGTPPSPETTSGSLMPRASDRFGPAGDVYGVGAILYHLLTGRPPFHGETVHDVLSQLVLKDPVQVRTLNPTVPLDLQTICLKCLEKDPARRYASALQVAEELERWRLDRPILARPISAFERGWRWCRRQPALATLGVVAFLVPLVLIIGTSAAAVRIERARTTAQSLLQRNRIQVAEGHFSRDETGLGIVELTRVLREEPTHSVAAQRLLSALTHRRFPIPVGPPLRHEGQIRRAVFSPDSARVATASADGTARLWDGRNAEPLCPPMRHEILPSLRASNALWSVAFSPDGTRLATASANGTARVWDGFHGTPAGPPLEHGKPVEPLKSFHIGVCSVLFMRDGRQLVTTGDDGFARVWNVTNGAPIATFPHSRLVWIAAVSPDEKLLATACWDESAYLWNLETGQKIAALPHTSRIWSVAFDRGGDRLLTGERQWFARVWKRLGDEWTKHLDLYVAGDALRAMFTGDEREIFTISTKGYVQSWDAASGKERFRLHQKGRVLDMDMNPDCSFLVVTPECASATLFSRDGERIMEPLLHDSTIRSVRFSPDGTRVVSAGDSGEAWIWQVLTSPRLEKYFHGSGDWHRSGIGWVPLPDVLSAAPSPRDDLLVTVSADHTVFVWDRHTGRKVYGFRHEGFVFGTRFSASGSMAVTYSQDGTARIWDVTSGSQMGPLLHQKPGIKDAAFSPDASFIVTGGEDHRAHLWSLPANERILTFPHRDDIRTVRFSPDGKRILTASDDHTAQVWSATTGQPVAPPLVHDNEVHWAEFSPDGRRVATASRDHTARVWDAATSKPMGPDIRHESLVSRVRFDPSGSRLLTCAEDRTVHVVDVASGRELFPPILHGGKVEDAAFAPDGRWIVTCALDGNFRCWDATTGQALSEPLHFVALGAVPTGDGREIVTFCRDGIARIPDAPTLPPPVPEWFLTLAETLGGLRIKGDSVEPVSPEALYRLKVRFQEKGGNDDFYDRWAQWFFADPTLRTITPQSKVTFSDYLRRLEESGTYPALREASQLAPTNARIMAKFAITEFEAKVDFKPEARYRVQRALQLAPDDPDVRRAAKQILGTP